jgi:hypothetical protein
MSNRVRRPPLVFVRTTWIGAMRVPLAPGGITALMALIIRLEGDRDDQNLSYAATFRQGSRGEHTWR